MFPAKQARGGAEAYEALLDMAGALLLVVGKGHYPVPVAKGGPAFRAIPRCCEVSAENELLGLQRVKHGDLRVPVIPSIGIPLAAAYSTVVSGTNPLVGRTHTLVQTRDGRHVARSALGSPALWLVAFILKYVGSDLA